MTPDEKWHPEPLRPAGTVSRPDFTMPQGACDAHMHVFGPAARYPSVPDALYHLPEGGLDAYLAVCDALGIERMVVVQPSFYGTDNACLLDALDRAGKQARGVVFLPDHADDALIESLHHRGVRGIRLNFFKDVEAGASLDRIVAKLEDAATRAGSAGWHLELYSPGQVTLQLLDHLAALDVDFSVNHMGYMASAHGRTDADFERFLDLARYGRCWVKLTAPYRVEKHDPSARTDGMARALIAAAPDRVIWGTDWPHIPQGSRDTGELLTRLASWCPDPATRNRILADNPARLYRFE